MFENAKEKIAASKILSATAEYASERLIRFSGWLIGAFGAAVGLLLVNVASLSQFISPHSLGSMISCFVSAFVFHVIQRWLAISSASNAVLDQRIEAVEIKDVEGLKILIEEIRKATLPFNRWFLRKEFKKIAAGDLAFSGRRQFQLAQLQSIAVLAQLVSAIVAIVIIVRGLKS